jgi:hypothetical protein
VAVSGSGATIRLARAEDVPKLLEDRFGARAMDEWTTLRLDGDALGRVASESHDPR